MQLKDRVVVTGPSHPSYGKVGTITGLAPASRRVWVRFEHSGEQLIKEHDLTVQDDRAT